MKDKINQLERKLNLFFKNKKLLKTVFIHRSYLNENKRTNLCSNERLEFLGDSVLSFLTAFYLYKSYPHLNEGDYSEIKANIVSTESLARIAKTLNLGNYLFLSKGEEKIGGRTNSNILADCFEALTGAIFLEFGLNTTHLFIKKYLFSAELDRIIKYKLYLPAKSRLQEYLQGKYKKTPNYKTIETFGPEHNKEFKVGVFFNEKKLGEAFGRSKKEAEEKAALIALKKIKTLL